MIGLFRNVGNDVKSKFRFQYFPQVVDCLIAIAIVRASRKLRVANVQRLLVDNSVLGHGVTHETAWIDTGKSYWGDVEVNTGYAARIPVHDDGDERGVARSVRYLPGIANLARRGEIVFMTSPELKGERLTQPSGRFRGYGWYDLSLFDGIKFESIEDPDCVIFLSGHSGRPSLKEQRRRRLESKADPLFRQLVSVLGQKNSQDAWHIATAENNDCYCFLTMDFRLIRNVRAQAKNATIMGLRTKILTPEEFGKNFGIASISPRLFSYHGASYPVEHNVNWEDSKRHKPRKR